MSGHHCHAVGCAQRIPPRLFMCRPHWFMVPTRQRKAVWAAYRPGQEEDKRPSSQYLRATNEARRIVAMKEDRLVDWKLETPSYERTIAALEARVL